MIKQFPKIGFRQILGCVTYDLIIKGNSMVYRPFSLRWEICPKNRHLLFSEKPNRLQIQPDDFPTGEGITNMEKQHYPIPQCILHPKMGPPSSFFPEKDSTQTKGQYERVFTF